MTSAMKHNSSIEILAPCGSLESVKAAVRQGADAVYIGSLRFSARAYAANFNDEQLLQAVRYCHLHGVKIHMAINTLISDEEIPEALEAAKKAYQDGVDAFIIQDFGLYSILKNACPQIAFHASTQIGVHTPQAAKLLYEHGFERVVLAREMNAAEIVEVVQSCPVETEVFVHGALCMCVSGQCYLSAMIGGRSGNRGRCAQPCRLPFSVKGGTGHDLSLKDNCLANELDQLQQAGVTSAKIEGRMKRPEYVAAASALYRHTADNGFAQRAEIDRLQAVFSRGGFTDGYYCGKLGRQMFGVRSKDDVISATEKVLSDIRCEYKNEPQTNSVSFIFSMKKDSPVQLTAQCGIYSAYAKGEIPQQAVKAPLGNEKVISQLSKTGGTAFKAADISVDIDEGITIPVSSLNSMRRNVLSELTEKITHVPERTYISPVISKSTQHKTKNGLKYRASFRHCEIPECFLKCELVTIPISSDISKIKSLLKRGFNIAVEIPRAFFGQEDNIKQKLLYLRENGIKDVYCNNIGAVALAKSLDMNIHGGFGLNIFNTNALEFYKRLGVKDTELSIELTAEQINKIGGDCVRGAVGYGYLPLMIMRNCPNKNGGGCRSCNGKSLITDRKGNTFAMMCESGCTELLNYTPLVLSDKQEIFHNAEFLSLRFTFESKEESERVFNDYLNKNNPHGKYTRGLYFRGVE